MKKRLNKILLLLLFTLILSLIGCAPKGEPKEVLNKYYENIKEGNVQEAYDLLSEESKKNFKKEDFIKWEGIQQKTFIFKEVKIEKKNEYKDKELDGIKFKNVVEFKISEKVHDVKENKEDTLNYRRHVVNDNGKWKIYRGKEDGKEKIANALNGLAWVYIEDKNPDLNKAAALLNDALKEKKDYINTYYSLANTYVRLERYDEAINNINVYLSKEKDSSNKSDGYNILGIAYEGKDKYDKAKENYLKAIELNSNNQYAKTNLERVKKY